MDNVEDYALVNETVDAVRSVGMKGLTGFVNGVLRTALRQKDSILARLERQPPATRYSHPELLIRRWTAQHGEEKAIELCKWNNSRPSITMRIRHSKTNMDEMLTQLSAMDVEASKNALMPNDCIDLGHGVKVTDLPGFADGCFMIQDASTLVPVKLLDPKPGETVLDACAAPGGKTIHISDSMGGVGKVVAMDVSERRLAAVNDNATRTGATNVKTTTGDASSSTSLPKEKFDAVLVDAPCTNTGVLRRRPEGKWRFSKGSLQSSATVQRSLLDACSSVVKQGGRLVYSTCSLEPEEGETVVERWLNSNTDFKLSDSKYIVPPGSGSDGGYSALLIKSE